MTRINYSLILICLCMLIACNTGVNQENLSGQWKVVNMTVNSTKLSPAIIEGGKEEALSSIYTFGEGNQIHMKSNFIAEGRTGDWEYNPTDSVIRFKYEGAEFSKPEVYKVTSFDGNAMIWSQDLGEMGALKMTLKKEAEE